VKTSIQLKQLQQLPGNISHMKQTANKTATTTFPQKITYQNNNGKKILSCNMLSKCN